MSKPNSLRITKQKGKVLTAEQLAFNKINDKINKQALRFEKDKERFDSLLHYYNENIEPTLREISREKMNMAVFIHESTNKFKYTKKQKEKIGETIVYLMEEGFALHEPTDIEKSIYDFWSPQTYDEIEAEEIESQKDYLKDMMEMFGFGDIDFDNFDPNNPEKIAKMADQFKEAQEKKFKAQENTGFKKTKRQKQQEEEEKAMQTMQKKSLREIYIGLAKVFHPDSSDTTVDISQKEEIMKQLNNAYSAGDLPTLLKIETEWIAKQENNIDLLSSDKLKVYINLLKKRLADMENEYYLMRNNPMYSPVEHLFNQTKTISFRALALQKKDLEVNLKQIRLDSLKINNNADKKMILEFAEMIFMVANAYESNFDDDDDLLDFLFTRP